MKRTTIVTLLLSVLALVAVGHHQLARRSNQALCGLATPALAADLTNGFGDTCNGTGTWHFVNPHADGDCEPLTVTFSCGGTIVTKTASIFKCNTNTTNYNTIQTSGDCTLISASNTAPGKVVLSSLFCAPATPTPTPTPTPTATPTPTPTPTP
jgi:hypothetical protein